MSARKLTWAQAQAIRRAFIRDPGLSIRSLAKQHGVERTAVYKILRQETYRTREQPHPTTHLPTRRRHGHQSQAGLSP